MTKEGKTDVRDASIKTVGLQDVVDSFVGLQRLSQQIPAANIPNALALDLAFVQRRLKEHFDVFDQRRNALAANYNVVQNRQTGVYEPGDAEDSMQQYQLFIDQVQDLLAQTVEIDYAPVSWDLAKEHIVGLTLFHLASMPLVWAT